MSQEEGARVAQLFACLACHADDNSVANAGPTWKKLHGSQRPIFVDGKPVTIKVDDAYLRESILDPAAKIASKFEKSEFAMPSYAGVLTDAQVESLILYIKSMR